MTERRQFSRIAYRAPALLEVVDDTISCMVLDMSLHGVCTTHPDVFDLNQTHLNIRIRIPESDIELAMDIELVSYDDSHLRFRIDQIDIDSISHLKRLVSLNLGDPQLLEREIANLSHIMVD